MILAGTLRIRSRGRHSDAASSTEVMESKERLGGRDMDEWQRSRNERSGGSSQDQSIKRTVAPKHQSLSPYEGLFLIQTFESQRIKHQEDAVKLRTWSRSEPVMYPKNGYLNGPCHEISIEVRVDE